jgi:hypothetical protein
MATTELSTKEAPAADVSSCEEVDGIMPWHLGTVATRQELAEATTTAMVPQQLPYWRGLNREVFGDQVARSMSRSSSAGEDRGQGCLSRLGA